MLYTILQYHSRSKKEGKSQLAWIFRILAMLQCNICPNINLQKVSILSSKLATISLRNQRPIIGDETGNSGLSNLKSFFGKKHTVGTKTAKSQKIELTLHFYRTTIACWEKWEFLKFTLLKRDKKPSIVIATAIIEFACFETFKNTSNSCLYPSQKRIQLVMFRYFSIFFYYKTAFWC